MKKCLWLVFLGMLFSCEHEVVNETRYFVEVEGNYERAYCKFTINDTLLSGTFFRTYFNDTVFIKGVFRHDTLIWKTFDNPANSELNEDYDYRKIVTGRRIDVLKDLAYIDSTTLKPLSKKIYQKKVDSLFKPVTLVNRHGTVEHDGFVFDIDIRDYNPDTFEGKTTISVKNNSGNEVQIIISDKFLFNDHIALGFEDYNFDGVDDIYVYNGQNGSYSTQTYEYYLFDKKAGNYQYSDELTSLTTRIGMKVDRKNKRLLIYSRGSCCNHMVQAYRYTDNHYTEFKRMEDFDEDTRYKVVIEELVGNKWMKTDINYEGRKNIDKAIDYWRKKF